MDFLKLGKLLQDYYAIPDYQREYEWTNTQNAVLLDDIFDLINNPTNENHFTGAIVSIPFEKSNARNISIDLDAYEISESNVRHIVDGQQRLTSISILIEALRRLIDSDSSISDDLKSNYKQQLNPLLFGSESISTSTGYLPAPRIILSGNSGKCYNKHVLHISSDSYNGIYKGAKRITKALEFYSAELSNRKDEMLQDGVVQDNTQFYKKIIDVLRNKIIFVEIKCDDSYNAFQVFDSLNGKGLDLTAADRIKNILMSWSPKGKGATYWDGLVSRVGEDDLTSFFVALFFYNAKKRISKNRLPDAFKDAYKDSHDDFDYFYQSLIEDGAEYGQLRKCNTPNKTTNEYLKDLKQLNNEQAYAILFAVAKHFKNIDSDDFTDFVSAVIKLIVRMQVSEKNTNKLDGKFSEWIEMMRFHSASIQVVINKVDEFRLSICDDKEFEYTFSKFSPSDSKVAEYYLRSLENYKRQQANIRGSIERDLTVEHIIPQGLDPSIWYEDEKVPDDLAEDFKDVVIENIGNKALLYGDDNSAASDNVYSKKMLVYQAGKRGQNQGTPVATFQLIKELVENYPNRFKDIEVKDRAERLAKVAVLIW